MDQEYLGTADITGWMPFIHSFISDMHHYQCVAPNVDTNLQSGRFWATSIAYGGVPVVSSSSPRGKMLRSAWYLIRLTCMPFL